MQMEVEDMLPVDHPLEQLEPQPQDEQASMEGNVYYADLTGLQYYIIPGYDGAVGGGYVVPEAYPQPSSQHMSHQIQQYGLPPQQQQQQQYTVTAYAHHQQQPQHPPAYLQQQQPQYHQAHVGQGLAPLHKPVQHSTLTPTNSIQTPMTTSTISPSVDGATTPTSTITSTATMVSTSGTELTIIEPQQHQHPVLDNASNFLQQQQQCCQQQHQQQQQCCQHRSFSISNHHYVLPQPTLMCS